MSQSPDIRPVCGQTNNVPSTWLGGCYDHYDERKDHIKILRNVTAMVDYHSGSGYDPNGIPAYSWAEQTTAPDCSDYAPGTDVPYFCGAIGGAGNGNLPCGLPLTTSILSCGTNTQSLYVGRGYYNCLAITNETTSLTKCHDIGWKSVAAHKLWSGTHGKTSRTFGIPDAFDWCGACGWYHTADESPDTVKYTAIAGTAHWESHNTIYTQTGAGLDPNDPCHSGGSCGDGSTYDVCCYGHCCGITNDYSEDASFNTSVDHYGNSYGSCVSSSSPAGTEASAFARVGEALSDASQWVGTYTNLFEFGIPDVITGGGASWHLEWHKTEDFAGPCAESPTTTLSWTSTTLDISPYRVHVTIVSLVPDLDFCNGDGPISHPMQTRDATWTWDETSFTHDETFYFRCASNAPQETSGNSHVEGTLSVPYTSEDVYNDLISMLSQYPMDDDGIYPWRIDGSKTKVPLITRYETQTGLSIVCENNVQFTGEILGRPAPQGTDRVFVPWMPKMCECCDDGNGISDRCCTFYTRQWGDWSTAIGVPCATQWTDDFDAANMPDHAFVGNGITYTSPGTCNDSPPIYAVDDGMWAKKYAEIIFKKPSYNFARPCGPDRFSVSQSSARCITSSLGRTLQLESATDINTGDICWVCGTEQDGAWKVTKDSDTQYTLTGYVISSSLVATQSWQDCGAGMLAKIRWQHNGVLQPAICGRIDIESATNTQPITCSLADDAQLIDGDTVIVANARGNNINGVWKVGVLAPRLIVLSGSNGVSQSVYTSHGQMWSPDAVDWKWNDNQTKMDFSVRTYQMNNRDVGEYNRIVALNTYHEFDANCDGLSACAQIPVPDNPRTAQAACGISQNLETMTCTTSCLPFSACQPVVAFFSPNSESFHNSGSVILAARNFGFGHISYDDQYGSMWQGVVQQAMNDPIFEPVPCPCQLTLDNQNNVIAEYPCSCREDDGNCNADQAGDVDLGIPCIKYYPHRPILEARCEPPTGAPPLPPGYHLGCLTPAQVASQGSCDGNVCPPPQFGLGGNISFDYDCGSPWCNTCPVYPPHFNDYTTPWLTYLAMLGCVCADGRFGPTYTFEDGILCDETWFVAAP